MKYSTNWKVVELSEFVPEENRITFSAVGSSGLPTTHFQYEIPHMNPNEYKALVAVPDSALLTREEVEKMVGDAFSEGCECGSSHSPKLLGKVDYIASLNIKDK